MAYIEPSTVKDEEEQGGQGAPQAPMGGGPTPIASTSAGGAGVGSAQPQQAAPTGAGPQAAPAPRGGQAPAQPGAYQQKRRGSGRFTNIKKFIEANKPATQQMGQKFEGQFAKAGTGLQKDIGSQRQAFQKSAGQAEQNLGRSQGMVEKLGQAGGAQSLLASGQPKAPVDPTRAGLDAKQDALRDSYKDVAAFHQEQAAQANTGMGIPGAANQTTLLRRVPDGNINRVRPPSLDQRREMIGSRYEGYGDLSSEDQGAFTDAMMALGPKRRQQDLWMRDNNIAIAGYKDPIEQEQNALMEQYGLTKNDLMKRMRQQPTQQGADTSLASGAAEAMTPQIEGEAAQKQLNDLELFRQLQSGSVATPEENLAAQAQEAQLIREQAESLRGEEGRREMLGSTFGKPTQRYSSGQQSLDQLLLQTDPDTARSIIESGQGVAGGAEEAIQTGQEAQKARLAAIMSQAGESQEAIAQALGTWGEGGGGALGTMRSELMGKQKEAIDKQARMMDSYNEMRKTGQISKEAAEALGLGNMNLYGAGLGDLLNQVEMGDTKVELADVADEEQRARFDALQQLANQQNSGLTLGEVGGTAGLQWKDPAALEQLQAKSAEATKWMDQLKAAQAQMRTAHDNERHGLGGQVFGDLLGALRGAAGREIGDVDAAAKAAQDQKWFGGASGPSGWRSGHLTQAETANRMRNMYSRFGADKYFEALRGLAGMQGAGGGLQNISVGDSPVTNDTFGVK